MELLKFINNRLHKTLITAGLLGALGGCTSNINNFRSEYTYNKYNSYSQNLMTIASSVNWDHKDTPFSSKKSQNEGNRSYAFEASYAAMGAANNLSSIGDALTGAGVYGLAALAIPDPVGPKAFNLSFVIVSESELFGAGPDVKLEATRIIADRFFKTISENIQDVEYSLYQTKNVTPSSEIEPIESMIAGKGFKLSFGHLPEASKFKRDCPRACELKIYDSYVNITGPFKSKAFSSDEPLSKDENHYIISTRKPMANNALLYPARYKEFFSDDMFYYLPNYLPDPKNKTIKVPAVLSKNKANFFIKPKYVVEL